MIIGKILDSIFYSLITFACFAIPIQFFSVLHPLVALLPMIGSAMLIIFSAICFFTLPTLKESATELDKINRTHDLLSTALYSMEQPGEWSASIVQIADHQSRSMKHPPMIGRISPAIHLAGWSGIAGVMLLSMLVQNTSSIATAQKFGNGGENQDGAVADQSERSDSKTSDDRRVQESKSDELNDQTNQSSDQNKSADRSATGTGKSDFKIKATSTNPSVDQTSSNHPSTPTDSPLAGLAPGESQSGNTSSGVTQTDSSQHLWESRDWKNKQPNSDDDSAPTRDDQTYRDLIREYFNR